MNIISVLATWSTWPDRFIQRDLPHSACFLSQQLERIKRQWSEIRHWPIYLSGAVGIASTIAAIASMLFHNIPQALLQGFMAVGSFIVAVKLPSYIPMKRLEDQVSDIVRSTQTFQFGVERMTLTAHSLESTRQGFHAHLEEDRIRADAVEQSIRSHERTFQALHARMATIQEALDRTSKLKTSWEELAHVIAQEVSSFNDIVKKFSTQDIDRSLTELRRTSQGIEAQFAQSRELIHHIGQAREGLLPLLERMQKQFSELKTDADEKTALMREQEALLLHIREESDHHTQNMERIRPMVENVHQVAEKYRKAKDCFDRAVHELQILLDPPGFLSLRQVRETAQRAINALREAFPATD